MNKEIRKVPCPYTGFPFEGDRGTSPVTCLQRLFNSLSPRMTATENAGPQGLDESDSSEYNDGTMCVNARNHQKLDRRLEADGTYTDSVLKYIFLFNLFI